METVRTVELFAGVGGFRLGLEVASDRYKVIWANQWEPSDSEQCAFGCYTAHFGPREEYVCRDITKVRAASRTMTYLSVASLVRTIPS